jgi:hypothetical protein
LNQWLPFLLILRLILSQLVPPLLVLLLLILLLLVVRLIADRRKGVPTCAAGPIRVLVELGGHVHQEPGRHPGMRHDELRFGPCHGDVCKTSLLIDPVLGAECTRVGEVALLERGDNDHWPLAALGRVHRCDGDPRAGATAAASRGTRTGRRIATAAAAVFAVTLVVSTSAGARPRDLAQKLGHRHDRVIVGSIARRLLGIPSWVTGARCFPGFRKGQELRDARMQR